MAEAAIVLKKKSKVGPVLWSIAALGLAFRTLYRPARAVMKSGYAVRCPGGAGCPPAMTIQASTGSSEIYAVTSGKVAIGKDGSVTIVSDREPIVVGYGPGAAQLFVRTGDDVGLGQVLGLMTRAEFSVTEIVRDTKGVSFRPLEPASWLAARGLRVATSGAVPSELWCSHGRRITVPRATLGCGIRLPEPSSMMLLPVSVTTE